MVEKSYFETDKDGVRWLHVENDETGTSDCYRMDNKKTPTFVSDSYGARWV